MIEFVIGLIVGAAVMYLLMREAGFGGEALVALRSRKAKRCRLMILLESS